MQKKLAAGAMLIVCAAFTLAPRGHGMTETSGSLQAVPDYLVPRWLPDDLKELERRGQIREAEELLASQLSDTRSGTTVNRELLVEKERLRRLRLEFPLTASEMLAKILKDIPDVGERDLVGWTEAGLIQYVRLDGEVRYFRREPTNLYRLSDGARARRDAAASRDPQTSPSSAPAGDPAAGRRQTLVRHLEAAVKAAESRGTTFVLPCQFKVCHTVVAKPGVVPEGETLRCWIPLPRAYRQQSAWRNLRTLPEKHRLSPEGALQSTVYLELPAGGAGECTTFTAEYSYTSSAFVPRVDPETVHARDSCAGGLDAFLGEQPPHLVMSPELRELASRIVGNETNPYRKAERIFRWFDTEFRYCSEMNYAVVPSVVEKAMAVKRGDCGVHAMLFIALCRASGVPARWQSGWVARPDYWNMHDWAEFYVEPYGWLPADPSVGRQKSDDPRIRDFLFGGSDAYRMIANLGFDTSFDPEETHWRSDPVDSQKGEVQWRGGNLYFDQWDSDIKVSVESLAADGLSLGEGPQ